MLHAASSTGGVIAVAAMLLLPALPLLGQPARPSDADKSGTIRMAGPLAAKDMMEALAAEFAKGKNAPSLDYARNDAASSAVSSLVSGRDMILTLGRVSEKDIAYYKNEWKALTPAEHILCARSLAIVVHGRSGVDSLTMEQIESIYSGKTADWKVLTSGNDTKTIHRYALPPADPLTTLFHDKALSSAKCGSLQRKKDSAELLIALAGDPQGIGFVDAVAASAAGDSIKILALGDGKSALAPNAQTIKDGTYPLAQTLILYVSPKASDAAGQFTQFILAGQGDAIIRKHGFMPTLRSMKADVLPAFEKLYGADIKRVKATADTADDLALAIQMVQSARTTKLEAPMLEAMCEAAYDLTAKVAGGQSAAFEAMAVLAEKVPDRKFDCLLKRAAIYQRAYEADKSRASAEPLIAALTVAADAGTSAHRFAEAVDAWKKALAVSEENNSPRLATIKERMPAFAARSETTKQLATLESQLRADPQDAKLRRKLLDLHLLELDDPAEAAKFLDAAGAGEEALKTNIPLAASALDKLSEDAALMLAEWYTGLIDKAGPGGKELLAGHARNCYLRFFAMHKDRDDALATRASLGIQKIGGKVPDPPAPTAPGKKPTPTPPPPPPDDMTDLTLAEYVAGHGDVTRLGRQEIGSARQVTDLRSLSRLTKLTSLELQQAGNVKDFSPLGKIGGLTALTITGLEVDSISALSGMSNLTSLDLSGAKNVSDIAPIGKLVGLKQLNLSGCSKVADLTPLSRLTGLTTLNLSGCDGVSDLAPLEKLAKNLTSLSLNGCVKASDVYKLAKLTKLKNLDLRSCDGISEDDRSWLAKRLKDCKILPAPPVTKDE
jgi:ABC-type phosphate transport system substrate-binding protein